MDKPSDWVVLTQQLGYCPEGWVKHLTQLLVENNPIAGFVHILPSAGFYLTQHFLEYSYEDIAMWQKTLVSPIYFCKHYRFWKHMHNIHNSWLGICCRTCQDEWWSKDLILLFIFSKSCLQSVNQVYCLLFLRLMSWDSQRQRNMPQTCLCVHIFKFPNHINLAD